MTTEGRYRVFSRRHCASAAIPSFVITHLINPCTLAGSRNVSQKHSIEDSAKTAMPLDSARLHEKYYGETLDPESVKGFGFCWCMNAEDKDAYSRNS